MRFGLLLRLIAGRSSSIPCVSAQCARCGGEECESTFSMPTATWYFLVKVGMETLGKTIAVKPFLNNCRTMRLAPNSQFRYIQHQPDFAGLLVFRFTNSESPCPPPRCRLDPRWHLQLFRLSLSVRTGTPRTRFGGNRHGRHAPHRSGLHRHLSRQCRPSTAPCRARRDDEKMQNISPDPSMSRSMPSTSDRNRK